MKSEALIAIMIVLSWAALALGNSQESRVRQGGTKAWKGFVDGVKFVEIHARMTITAIGPDEAKCPPPNEFVVKLAGPRSLVEDSPIFTTTQALRSKVYCITPDLTFILNRRGNAPRTIGYRGKNSSIAQGAIYGNGIACAHMPLWLHDRPLYKIVEEPGFKINSAESHTVAGNEIVRVDFTYASPPKEFSELFGGWVDLQPKSYWVIKEYDVRTRLTVPDDAGRQRVARTYLYGEPVDGLPRILSCQATYLYPEDGGKRTATEVIDFAQYEVKKTADSEFTVAAYGIGVPAVETRPGPFLAIFVLVNAVVVLLVAVVLYRRSKTSRG